MGVVVVLTVAVLSLYFFSLQANIPEENSPISLSEGGLQPEPQVLEPVVSEVDVDSFENDVQGVVAEVTPDSLDVLVDKTHAIPSEYEPKDLLSLSSIGVETEGRTAYMRVEAAQGLKKMMRVMVGEGMKVSALSTYRSYDFQTNTYDSWVNRLGGEQADRVSAEPGHSEHQLGTTVDLVLPGSGGTLDSLYPGKGTEEWTWLDQNAHKYGFVMSYRHQQEEITGYKFEPWHWRYVGEELATKIRLSTRTPMSWYQQLAL